jgi:hypothetical protein
MLKISTAPADEINVFYLGQAEFIANKKTMGRHQDLADIEEIAPD